MAIDARYPEQVFRQCRARNPRAALIRRSAECRSALVLAGWELTVGYWRMLGCIRNGPVVPVLTGDGFATRAGLVPGSVRVDDCWPGCAR
jgi:hypothetical protein